MVGSSNPQSVQNEFIPFLGPERSGFSSLTVKNVLAQSIDKQPIHTPGNHVLLLSLFLPFCCVYKFVGGVLTPLAPVLGQVL